MFQVQSGGKATGTAAYLNNASDLLSSECKAQSMEDFLRSDIQLHAYDRRATQLIASTGMMLQQAVAQGICLFISIAKVYSTIVNSLRLLSVYQSMYLCLSLRCYMYTSH